jgi:flagellar basal-body rod protein FlgG
LQLNQTGQFVTADGYQIIPSITVPNTATAITVNASGQVLATIAGQTNQQTLGQIQLANFINPAGLNAIGNNLLKETQASGTPTTGNPQAVGFGSMVQGSLETSNVDIVSEITNLISAQRAYEMNSKVITTADQMLSTANQTKT